MNKVVLVILVILLIFAKIGACASLMQLVWTGIAEAFELPSLPWYTYLALATIIVGLTSTKHQVKNE